MTQQALYWEVSGYGRTRTSEVKQEVTIKKDLLMTGFAWEEAETAALMRQEWRRSVARCIHVNAA